MGGLLRDLTADFAARIQAALFYEFSLERHVPVGHLLRSIDRFVDLSEVRGHLAPFFSWTGRPSIDPELLLRKQARDVARHVAKTDAYVRSRRERKKIEMLFAHLKRILRLDRLRLRGPFGAQDEFLLAARVVVGVARQSPGCLSQRRGAR